MPFLLLGLFLIPAQSLFERKAQMKRDDIQLSVSYMEIYKDDVYDLLVTRENVCLSRRHLCAVPLSPLHVGSQTTSSRESRGHGLCRQPLYLPLVICSGVRRNLCVSPCSSPFFHSQLTPSYRRATNNRSVGATKLNHASSRSHAVLTIDVTMPEGDRSES